MMKTFIILAVVCLLCASAKPPKRSGGLKHEESPKGEGHHRGPRPGQHDGHEKGSPDNRGPPMCRIPPAMAEGCDPPMGMPESKMRIVNNGISEISPHIESMKGDLVDYLNNGTNVCEEDFEEEDIVEMKMRGPEVVMKIRCQESGETHYASFKVNTHSSTVLEEKPKANNLMGGYRGACSLGQMHNYFIAFAKEANPDAETCKIDSQWCLEKTSVRNGMYFCPVDCDGTVTNMELAPLEYPQIEVTEVTKVPSSKCFEMTTNEYMTGILRNSTRNTFAFLKDHCKFEGEQSDIKVASGAFVDLFSGTQHCVTVYTGTLEEKTKTTTLALYQFNLAGTDPFLVAHPFPDENMEGEGMMKCMYFMVTVHDLWQMS